MGELSYDDDDEPVSDFRSFELSHRWEFREVDDTTDNAWMPVKQIPSTVQQDLMDNNRLEDPFIGFNEIKAEWVATKSWVYRNKFTVPTIPAKASVVLSFEGLDTFAEVKLDGRPILKSDNMFLPHRVDITDHVKTHTEHELRIVFDSALCRAKEIKGQYPDHKWICSNGDPSRLAVRKAQYHWGWDWGPIITCAGIWKPIRVEIYHSRVSEVRIDTIVSKDHKSATIYIIADIEVYDINEFYAAFRLRLGKKEISIKFSDVSVEGRAVAEFHVKHPKLWMPNGYGEQTLYTVDVAAAAGWKLLHSVSRNIGIRSLELVQQPDARGKSFYFRVNGVDIFCGGSCWIPADSILTNVTPDRYRAWLELMIPANQKMIRVWGGGIYENDEFYSICDELGILVWQDFMFACGNYTCHESFLSSVEAEAIANVRRIRHHPCIAIFAGNNEDYQVAEQSGLTYNYSDKDESNWLKTDFPARYIYESLLPGIMRTEAPTIPYHPGSPWGDGKPTSDPTVGDMHQWNVWHGTQEQYQIFDTLGGRFNSEFGMEAFPHITTIKSFVPDPQEFNKLHPQSQILDFHNKAAGHERRIATYMIENVRLDTKLESYIHLTQLIQAEALMYGYRGWRKQWDEYGTRHCGGALVWQLNDCWPVTSWSIVDYYLRRKPAYYTVARTLAPIAVGIKREHHDWTVSHARTPNTQSWEVWIASSKLQELTGVDVEVRFVSVKTGKEIKNPFFKRGITVKPNGTTPVAVGVVDNVSEETHVLAARVWVDGEVVARDTDWPQPLKYLAFAGRDVKVEMKQKNTIKNNNSDDGVEMEIYVSAKRPVKCLVFEERDGCRLSDNAIDVVPGDTQVIKVKGKEGLPNKPLSWRYLGMDEQ